MSYVDDASRVAALEQRVAHMRALGHLRRSVRELEEPAQIAAAAVRFALDVIGCASFVIYLGDKDAPMLDLLSEPLAHLGLEPALPRTSELVAPLEDGASAIPLELFDGRALPPGTKAEALALRGAPTELIGVVLVVGAVLDHELLDELVVDLESVLSARMVARLRAEELAVLEIQERELVGLLREVEARDTIIQRDLEQARAFQHQMLDAPPRVEDASIEVVYQPLELVGGDLYAMSVEGDRLRVFVADATGHGIRASLTTMFIKSSYEAVRRAAPDPAALLARLNHTIASTYGSTEMLFTAACVDLDLATGRCLTASGAHPDICVVQRSVASFVDGSGPWLGVKADLAFTNQELVLDRGDGLYIYTDGFIEARDASALFGSARFLQVIEDAHGAEAPAGRAVVTAVGSFLAGSPLTDDGTFIGIRRA